MHEEDRKMKPRKEKLKRNLPQMRRTTTQQQPQETNCRKTLESSHCKKTKKTRRRTMSLHLLLVMLIFATLAPVMINASNISEIVRNDIQFTKLVKLDNSNFRQHNNQPPSQPISTINAATAAATINHAAAAAATTTNQHSLRFFNLTTATSDRNNRAGDIYQTDYFKYNKNYKKKDCMGTSVRLSGHKNRPQLYLDSVERYTNCTHIIGNLELAWLEDTPDKRLDMSFLESIREITGYLFIGYVNVERIYMPNLQIIRGRELFDVKGEGLALFLIQNNIKSLELPNLREILAGSFGWSRNTGLCHLRTINWDEILNPPYKTMFDYNGPPPECAPCDKSCLGNCWAEGPDMCQQFSKVNCAAQCNQGRCFGTAPRECCHLFCAGGCSGPKQTDCLACKNFQDDGECVQECPPMQKYNPSTFSWEHNPKGKYAYGADCVKECPDHLLRDNGACVRFCPPNKRSSNGECINCSGPCPRECQGETIHSDNIEQFINCTTIEGSITISEISFSGFTELISGREGQVHGPMHPSSLMALKNVRNITGYLKIEATHKDFTDLSFLRNLEYIDGRQLLDMKYAFIVYKTSLKSLNLRSLKKVKLGKVTIENNHNLCFEDTDKWSHANITKSEDLTISENCDQIECQSLGLRCHEECGPGGCWGPRADDCISCNNYSFEDSCVVDCASTILLGHSSYDMGNRTCKRCHSECKTGCKGMNSSDCFECKNFKDGPYCVSDCPIHKFNNNGICQECNQGCVGGCTGPSRRLGSGGCNACGKVVLETPGLVSHCIKADESCPDGYFAELYHGPLESLLGKTVCSKCNSKCKTCTGPGNHRSVCTCARYTAGDQCEDVCPRDFYADARSRECFRCHQECNGCHGPTAMDCAACRVYRVFPEGSEIVIASKGKPDSMGRKVLFNCTSHCPPEKPYRISDSNLVDPYCSDAPSKDSVTSQPLSGSWFLFSLMAFLSSLMLVCASIYKCKIETDRTFKLAGRLSGIDDDEPLNQSNVKPNLAPLKSIKETELRRGNLLGSGYGGKVYQGLWSPEGQENIKRPVAIKVLRDNVQANMNKEFLDEAYIMASVKHPNLVSLLAVCETPTQLMLVTPLIPLGCLLDYVRTNKNSIGSKNLLEWSKQIAKGMAYLEECRMVHRDLALRNVLLQKTGRAMISDFGLAKFLDVDQNEYQSGGGRLPIKWLALECIKERKFTHKSDVWAFGITVWELLSFGKVPYEGYEAKDVPSHVEQGMRLDRPEGVSLEVFKELRSCWWCNPDQRPSFKDLAESFVNFARDPERYLTFNERNISNWKGQEFGRSSGSEESVSDEFRFTDDRPQFHSTLPDLIHSVPSAQGDRNELIGFELRHHSESEGINGQQHVSTPTTRKPPNPFHQSIDEDIFSSATTRIPTQPHNNFIKDLNNNNNNNLHGFGGSTRTSSESVKRADLPTDDDNYLLPSPFSNDAKFKFQTTQFATTTNSSRFPSASPSMRDPPHSAGLIGVSNAEYFSRQNYVSSSGGAQTNASSGHIPHSLV